jgi:hypothetical protein
LSRLVEPVGREHINIQAELIELGVEADVKLGVTWLSSQRVAVFVLPLVQLSGAGLIGADIISHESCRFAIQSCGMSDDDVGIVELVGSIALEETTEYERSKATTHRDRAPEDVRMCAPGGLLRRRPAAPQPRSTFASKEWSRAVSRRQGWFVGPYGLRLTHTRRPWYTAGLAADP